MAETIAFFLFCLAVGYLLYWTITNEKHCPDRGERGILAIKPPVQNNERNNQPRYRQY